MIRWMLLQRLAPELAVAQFGELRQQVPLLYLLLSVNTVAAAYTHLAFAPAWMTLWVPAGLIAISAVRFITWLLQPAGAADPAKASAALLRTTILSFLISLAFVAWALKLSQYGGVREQAHVAIYIAITVIGCIFCLFPLPQAAVTTLAVVTIPYLFYYLTRGDDVFVAIAINILLVTLVMLRVLFNNYRGFVQQVRLNNEIALLARTDPLTGLPNRRHFFAELEAGIDAARRRNGDIAVGILDLDHFKTVNDTYGHLVGDKLLTAIGCRLREVLDGRGFAARLGGDEFALLFDAPDEAVGVANEICTALSMPIDLDGLTVCVGASCGLATLGGTDIGARTLYDSADYALYVGKCDRRGITTVYSLAHERRIRAEREMEAALQAADLDTELDVVVQPIVEGRSERIVAVEALARWTSPIVGVTSPAVFIPLAERLGMMHRMTLALFAKALKHAERLPHGTKLSFNLSAHDLASPETILGIMALMRQTPVAAGDLIFELTETALMRDVDTAERSMQLLKAAGAHIALDDFGTGYSSLSYLRRFPIDKVKIDRSFVAAIHTTEGRSLVAGILALCARIGLDCIAEGVEDQTQRRILDELECSAFQGYHFARPMGIEEFGAWLTEREAERGAGDISSSAA